MTARGPSLVERPTAHLGRFVEVSCGAGSHPFQPAADFLRRFGHGSASVRRGGRVAGLAVVVGAAGGGGRRVLRGARLGIGSGGARGADQFALEAVVAAGSEACRRSVVFLPGAQSAASGGALGAFVAYGGRVVPGSGAGRAALLGRSRRLAQASAGAVAFLWGPSRGSVFTAREAVRCGKPAAVVLAGGEAALPSFAGGRWARIFDGVMDSNRGGPSAACALGGVAAFRWCQSRRRGRSTVTNQSRSIRPREGISRHRVLSSLPGAGGVRTRADRLHEGASVRSCCTARSRCRRSSASAAGSASGSPSLSTS
jgi:hypothetical protein